MKQRRVFGLLRVGSISYPGAIVGGFIFSVVGLGGVTGLNPWSMLVAVVGGVVVVWLYHQVTGRTRL